MHRRPHIRTRQIHRQIRLDGRLIRIIHAREALNLPRARRLINPPLIRLLCMLQRRRDMDEVKTAILLHRVPRRLAGLLERRDGRHDGGGACFGEFGGDEGDARDVLVAVGAREAEFGAEFGAYGVAEEEGDGAPALLV